MLGERRGGDSLGEELLDLFQHSRLHSFTLGTAILEPNLKAENIRKVLGMSLEQIGHGTA